MDEIKSKRMTKYNPRGLWVGENSFPKPRDVIIRRMADDPTPEEIEASRQFAKDKRVDERRMGIRRDVNFPPRSY